MSISLDKMSLMRAFTTKRNRDAASPNVGRAASQRAGRPVVRGKISGPVALVSTSNELYINAEDVASSTLPEHVSSTDNSGEDSDASMLSLDTANITETSSIDSPLTPELEPNHLSCYFKPAIDTNSGAASPSMSRKTSFETVPAIPQRMPSHSKKAHETLHRKRSVQRMMSPSATIRSSLDMFGNATRSPSLVEVPENSPFGNELAQLDVVAEEFSSTVDDVQNASDLTCMQKHDLAAFAASDYLAEIQDLIMESFLDETSEPVWI